MLKAKGKLTHLLLSKFDAAERQLLQAITMFFRDEDPVSIHTLAEAASQVLYDIREKYGATSFLRDGGLIREDMIGLVRSFLFQSKNFLKHTDRDPGAYHEFKPAFNHVSLIDAVNMYWTIKKKWVPETFVFLVWYSREYPNHVRKDFEYTNMLKKVSRALPDQKDKQGWYNFIGMLRRGRVLNKNICLEYGL